MYHSSIHSMHKCLIIFCPTHRQMATASTYYCESVELSIVFFLNQGYLFLPSIFDKFFILDDVKLSELYKRMWHFRGQNILWPLLHIFRRSRLPQPPGSTPCWGKVYDACVWSCMIHGSETWLLKKKKTNWHCIRQMRMIRWMWCVKLWDKLTCTELKQLLGIEE